MASNIAPTAEHELEDDLSDSPVETSLANLGLDSKELPEDVEAKQQQEFSTMVARDKHLSFSQNGELVSGSMEHLTRYVIFKSEEGGKPQSSRHILLLTSHPSTRLYGSFRPDVPAIRRNAR